MASTIMLNLCNGQNIMLPFHVNVSVSAQTGAKVTAVSSQVDADNLHDVSDCMPTLPDSPVAGSCTIDGLAPNTWHTFTAYAWDDASPDPTTQDVTFHVFDPGGIFPPPLGP
jgi:hypothetical protein